MWNKKAGCSNEAQVRGGGRIAGKQFSRSFDRATYYHCREPRAGHVHDVRVVCAYMVCWKLGKLEIEWYWMGGGGGAGKLSGVGSDKYRI